VLDLGCGDGRLLALLAAPGRWLAGVDLSEGELAAAATRGLAAGLVQGRAHALPFADACVDAVVSHLAFTLMHDPDGVVREVERVLAPGGRFVAVVGGGPRGDRGDAFAGMLELARSAMRTVTVPRLGEVRARSDAGLAALFAAGRGWASLRVDDLPIDLSGTPDEVWEVLAGSYELAGVAADTVADLRARFGELCDRWRRADGAIECVLAARLVVAQRTGTGEVPRR
jgi:SAM-dependent methyltransferase